MAAVKERRYMMDIPLKKGNHKNTGAFVQMGIIGLCPKKNLGQYGFATERLARL
jgi:hypothetical protein